MMWAVMGIGMLVNTIQGAAQARQQNAQLAQMQQQNLAAAQKLKAGMQNGLNIKPGGIMAGPSTSIYVDYPEQAFKNFNQLQNNNLSERMGLESKLRSEFGEAKNKFFKENHYKTEFGRRAELVLDDAGRPQVMKGAESSDHRMVRENFEAQNRLALANKHAEQMDAFTRGEADKARNFLQNNAAHLNDPGVQAELQKMIVAGKKKSLKLQQEQDDEKWRVDMPPTEEIQEAIQLGMTDLREMEKRHVESEEKSADHQAILDYNRDFAAACSEQREAISEKKSDENFLLDPRKMMAMATEAPPKRFDEVLPGHLTEQLFQMGIYQV